MLWWHILFWIIFIHRTIHFVRSQDEGEESTTVPLSTTGAVEEQAVERISLIIPSRTPSNFVINSSEQNVNKIYFNESSKQRIIVALAVLCAALAVLLGFLVSIVVCQWFEHNENSDNLENGTSARRSDLVGSSYDYHNHACRQAIKL